MSLPAYVAPLLALVAPPSLVLVILRYGPEAVLRLLAGTVAVLTRDEKRGERCLEVLRILRRGPAAPVQPRTLTGKQRADQWRAPGRSPRDRAL